MGEVKSETQFHGPKPWFWCLHLWHHGFGVRFGFRVSGSGLRLGLRLGFGVESESTVCACEFF